MSENYFAEKCDFKPGEYVNNRYRVEKTLGEGSFGMVFKVLDASNQPYALKTRKRPSLCSVSKWSSRLAGLTAHIWFIP